MCLSNYLLKSCLCPRISADVSCTQRSFLVHPNQNRSVLRTNDCSLSAMSEAAVALPLRLEQQSGRRTRKTVRAKEGGMCGTADFQAWRGFGILSFTEAVIISTDWACHPVLGVGRVHRSHPSLRIYTVHG